MSGQSSVRTREPLWVGELDLATPSPVRTGADTTPDGEPYRRARLLVRFRGEPVGLLASSRSQRGDRRGRGPPLGRRGAPDGHRPGRRFALDPRQLAEPAVSAQLQAIADGAPPAVSVVIGTRNRPDHVVECIQGVLKQHYPSPVEVIVVDNGASDRSTAEAVEADFGADDRVRYMTEVRPGLSRARNIGLSAARYPITAFLSDDIRVDPLWLLALARGFDRHPDVACVSGICPPAHLDTTEQLLFESAMAWGSRQGFEPVLHRFHSETDPLHPYRVGRLATGANVAFRTDDFRRLGGFDEHLGPGTRARGGEDLDAPVRVLADGGLVAFEPAAIGWHADRFDDRAFSAHMYTYGHGPDRLPGQAPPPTRPAGRGAAQDPGRSAHPAQGVRGDRRRSSS